MSGSWAYPRRFIVHTSSVLMLKDSQYNVFIQIISNPEDGHVNTIHAGCSTAVKSVKAKRRNAG
eukprot:6205718-Pleurochrysis_carterae.AAC.2